MKIINIIILLINLSIFATAQSTTHIVETGQTFYSIAKMYNTTVADIKANNPQVDQNNMSIGTALNIYAPSVNTQTSYTNNSSGSPVYHTVAKGETLFGLAKRTYNVSVSDLRTWNSLTDNTLSVGQNIIVGWANNSSTTYTNNSTTVTTTAAPTSYPVSSSAETINNVTTYSTTSNNNSITSTPNKATPVSEGKTVYVSSIPSRGDLTDLKDSRTVYTSTVPSTSAITNSSNKYDTNTTKTENVEKIVNNSTESVEKVVESTNENVVQEAETEDMITKKYGSIATGGNQPPREIFKSLAVSKDPSLVLRKEEGAAKWFELDDKSIQIYAMHASAPIGSALKITNPINQTTIYVKVIDTLPPTAENTNTLMRLSSNAMSILKMYEKAFMVNVEYFDIASK